jgi:predicted aminopeptidase
MTHVAGSAAVALLLSLATPGCYLGHLAAGQARLLRARQPIEEVVADPATSAQLREQLLLVGDVRRFATGLGLDVGEQYTSFVPWPGDRVVTTVVATRPGELTPVGFRFPFVGTVPYKGFFDPERAEAEAERQRAGGRDVCVVGVAAYSTLGWIDDPVTGPMVRGDTGRFVETLLHELVHATVFVKDQVDFNEGVASFIGEEASVRFFEAAHRREDAERRRAELAEGRRIDSEILRLRETLESLYTSSEPGPGRDARRDAAEAATRAKVASLSLAERDAGALAAALRLNDACLALAATYTDDLDRYAERLAAFGDDLAAFVARLRDVADREDPRAALLAP